MPWSKEEAKEEAKEIKEARTFVTVQVDPDLLLMLDKVMKDYRAPTRAHALRLAIEDRFKEIGLREA